MPMKELPISLDAIQTGAKLLGATTAQTATAAAAAYVATYAPTTWFEWLPPIPDFWTFTLALAVLLLALGKVGARLLGGTARPAKTQSVQPEGRADA